MPPSNENTPGKESGLDPGTMVEHYRIVRPLGTGGMAEVYLARDTMLGRKVALKIIHPKQLDQKDAIKRFLFEAKATARFNHPHIVTIHGVGVFAGGPFLALEYVEGQTLRERLEQERLSAKEAIRNTRAIADALCVAHENDFLHRDLKPENIMLGKDGQLRVLDFGLSRLLRVKGTSDQDSNDELFRTSILKDPYISGHQGLRGTPAYMAPEQWKAEEIGPKTDIWSLGLIMYEMLFGRHPYHEVHNMAVLASRVSSSDPVPQPSSSRHVSSNVIELLSQCLAKDAAKRPSAQDIVRTLEHFLVSDRQEDLAGMSPFRGIVPFEEEHTPLFFGRDAEITSFVERLRHEPILPVVGPSGAGKSSFIKAGVVPRLREKGPLILIQLRPGRDPFLSVASVITAAWRQPAGNTATMSPMGSMLGMQKVGDELASESIAKTEDLARQFYDHPHMVGLWLYKLAERHRAYVVLFVDQLEELSAIVFGTETNPLSSEQNDMENAVGVLGRFMQAIAGAADDPQMPVRVILTLREEFLSRLLTSKLVRDALSRIVIVRQPSKKTLIDIMKRSLKAVGFEFEDYMLPLDLVKEVRKSQSRLSLLQFACQVLWQNRDEQRRVLTRSAYEEMGGVTGALVQHAEGVIKSLTTDETIVAKDLLLSLVTEEKHRRIISRNDMLDGLGENAQGVLERLIESRLVTISRKNEGEEGVCELVHEALITQWERLSQWIDENRDETKQLGQLKQASKGWNQRGRLVADLWRGKVLSESNKLVAAGVLIGDIEKRFLQACNKRRQRSLKVRASVMVVVFALLSSAYFIGMHYFHRQKCTKAKANIQEVWNQDLNTKIKTTFAQSGMGIWQDINDRVSRHLDDYSQQWVQMHTKTCKATAIEHAQSEEVRDLKMGCLYARRREISALARVLEKADQDIVQKAIQAAWNLTPVSVCDDVNALQHAHIELMPPPHSKSMSVEAVRAELARIKVLHETGKYDQGIKLAQVAWKRAAGLGYQPVQAEALFWLGRHQEGQRNHAAAERSLSQAHDLAMKCRHNEMMIRAANWLSLVIGQRRLRLKEGFLWAKMAEAILHSQSGADALRAEWHHNLGVLHLVAGDLDATLKHFRKALALRRSVYGLQHPLVAQSLHQIASASAKQGDFEEALANYAEANELYQYSLGAEHPELISALSDLGRVYLSMGDDKRAGQTFRQALAMGQRALYYGHPLISNVLMNIGQLQAAMGQHELAEGSFRRALVIRQETKGTDYQGVADTLCSLGEVLLEQGEYPEAGEVLERALLICRDKPCQTDPYGRALFALARVLSYQGSDLKRSYKLAMQAKSMLNGQPALNKKVEQWLAGQQTSKPR